MEICSQTSSGGLDIKVSPSVSSEDSGTNSARHSIDKEAELPTCRVCHCAESDKAGDAALEYLGIISPSKESSKSNEDLSVNNYDNKVVKNVATDCNNLVKNGGKEHRLVEFRSPDGEIFICRAEIGTGSLYHHNTLVDLGCSCKNDLSSAHYACALKWFVNHGSTVCEICGSVAQNVRTSDIKRIFLSLRDYEALRERTASGEPCPARMLPDTGIDPDAVAAIRRQRLSEIALWFGAPHGIHHAVSRDPDTALHVVTDQPSNTVTEDVVPDENPTTKWAVEGTGIFLATGLLTVTLAWLIAPRVGKRTASSGLHILLGGVCALTVVVFFRFVVLTRIKYGPARYWAILFVFWFLVFGIWASRTHEAHST